MSLTISLPCDRLAVLGRIDRREDALAFDWTNSGIYFRFRGNAITFHFDTPALSQELYVQVKLDRQIFRLRVCEGSTTIKVTAHEDAEHLVDCIRTNEILDAVPLVMRDITIDGEAPALLDPPKLPERRMMFIGDSITCGFGNLTKGSQPRFLTNEQDGTKTYAALTAAYYGAQAHFICISGRGIARNCDNSPLPLIPEFFDQTTISNPIPWDHTQYQPDIIIVNAGTNDTAGEGDPVDPNKFKNGIKDFVTHLLTVYPNAKLLWCYGMMETDMYDPIKDALEELNSPAVNYLFFKNVYMMEDELGGCTHPNVRAHYRCAGVLIDTISDILGWEM